MSSLLPDLKDLTKDQANRLICADYLRAVAGLIERGHVGAFELAWSNNTMHKPSGRVVMDSNFLIAPAEAEFQAKIEEAKDKISFEDLSEKLKDKDN